VDQPDTAPEPQAEPTPGLLARAATDEETQGQLAVGCLLGFVVFAAIGGFAWGHLPIMLGCWCAAGAMLVAALILGWDGPPEAPETTVTYYEGAVPPVPVPAPQPMRQPSPWDKRVG
jgi:hypothetical protein